MKLRNKKTGEIIDIYKGEITLHYDQGRKTIHFKRLEYLKEWEDVPEEPKEYWYINASGDINSIYEEDEEEEDTNSCKEIGNYFETKKEAEKAVEKLKAWKRLRDKGFRFIDHIDRDTGQGMTRYEWNGYIDGEDLDLLFGGEE